MTHAIEQPDHRLASMPLFDLDVSVEVMGERQIAVDLEGTLNGLLPSRRVHGRGRRIAELADQPVATSQPRPCRRELRIAIHRSFVEIERLRPFRGSELQLIGAQYSSYTSASAGVSRLMRS